MLVQDALEAIAGKASATIPGLTLSTADPGIEPLTPTAQIDDDGIEYHDSMSPAGYAVLTFTVTVFVSLGDTAEAARIARSYISASGVHSVSAAIETSSTVSYTDTKIQAVTCRSGRTGTLTRNGNTYTVAQITADARLKGA